MGGVSCSLKARMEDGNEISRGYIALSDASDVPVLLHIRNARAICFDQLRDLILFDCAGVAVNSLRWRVARMEKAGVIQRFQEVRHFGKPVYGITPAGVAFLESRGHMLFSLPSTTEKKIIHSLQIPHALELVNIRLALLRAGILSRGNANWKSPPGIWFSTAPRPRITTQSQKLRSMAWLIRSLLNTNEA
jgi:hypothetical protein